MKTFDKDSRLATLKNLRELYAKLYLLNPHDMTDAERDRWNEQFPAVSDALMILQNATLDEINAALDKDADKLSAAIERAERKLHGIQDTARVLKAIGSALHAITAIAAVVV